VLGEEGEKRFEGSRLGREGTGRVECLRVDGEGGGKGAVWRGNEGRVVSSPDFRFMVLFLFISKRRTDLVCFGIGWRIGVGEVDG